jgi:hypothetical protein
MSRIFRRLARLRAILASSGDVVPGDYVRTAWGEHGFVESITRDHALVSISRDHRRITELKYLTRAAADPAFGPDVREEIE